MLERVVCSTTVKNAAVDVRVDSLMAPDGYCLGIALRSAVERPPRITRLFVDITVTAGAAAERQEAVGQHDRVGVLTHAVCIYLDGSAKGATWLDESDHIVHAGGELFDGNWSQVAFKTVRSAFHSRGWRLEEGGANITRLQTVTYPDCFTAVLCRAYLCDTLSQSDDTVSLGSDTCSVKLSGAFRPSLHRRCVRMRNCRLAVVMRRRDRGSACF